MLGSPSLDLLKPRLVVHADRVVGQGLVEGVEGGRRIVAQHERHGNAGVRKLGLVDVNPNDARPRGKRIWTRARLSDVESRSNDEEHVGMMDGQPRNLIPRVAMKTQRER